MFQLTSENDTPCGGKNTIRHKFYRPSGPATRVLLNGDLECRTCSRGPCMASKPGYGAHCCPECAESNGQRHSSRCDQTFAEYESFAVDMPAVGDTVGISHPKSHREWSSGQVRQVNADGTFMVWDFGSYGWWLCRVAETGGRVIGEIVGDHMQVTPNPDIAAHLSIAYAECEAACERANITWGNQYFLTQLLSDACMAIWRAGQWVKLEMPAKYPGEIRGTIYAPTDKPTQER